MASSKSSIRRNWALALTILSAVGFFPSLAHAQSTAQLNEAELQRLQVRTAATAYRSVYDPEKKTYTVYDVTERDKTLEFKDWAKKTKALGVAVILVGPRTAQPHLAANGTASNAFAPQQPGGNARRWSTAELNAQFLNGIRRGIQYRTQPVGSGQPHAVVPQVAATPARPNTAAPVAQAYVPPQSAYEQSASPASPATAAPAAKPDAVKLQQFALDGETYQYTVHQGTKTIDVFGVKQITKGFREWAKSWRVQGWSMNLVGPRFAHNAASAPVQTATQPAASATAYNVVTIEDFDGKKEIYSVRPAAKNPAATFQPTMNA